MQDKGVAVSAEDQAILEAGYKPRLRRSLGFYSSFAVSFSYMSVLTGIFANYGFIIGKAGPFGIWTWPIVSVGHMFVALIFAEMAGRIPLTGCSYNWNSKLTSPVLGWAAGWMALLAYAVGVAAVTATIIPVLRSLLGFDLDQNIIRLVEIALILLQALINIYGVRLAAHINLVAVGAEIVALVGFGALIGIVLALHGHVNPSLLSAPPPSAPSPYLPAFLMACLLASWTLLGFEGAADISEETVDARTVAPKSIIISILACSILGFFFILMLSLGIADLGQVIAAADPVSTIVTGVLGVPLTEVFLLLVLISIFACSLVNMTGASRVLFAMARDGRLPVSSWLETVSRHQVPVIAIWLVTAAAIFFLLIADSLTALYGSGAVLYILFYIVTIFGYLLSARNLPTTDSFSLGKWHWPIVVLAFVWMFVEVGILTIPYEFHSVTLTTGGVLVCGLVVYLLWGRSPRNRPQMDEKLTN